MFKTEDLCKAYVTMSNLEEQTVSFYLRDSSCWLKYTISFVFKDFVGCV